MSRYAAGARLEYRVRDLLRRQGYVVLRAAGSKGPADLVALRRGRRPLLVAVSRRGVRPRARRDLVDSARRAGARAAVAHARGRGIEMLTVWDPHGSVRNRTVP